MCLYCRSVCLSVIILLGKGEKVGKLMNNMGETNEIFFISLSTYFDKAYIVMKKVPYDIIQK